MDIGDRVRIMRDETTDGSHACYVGYLGTVVIIKARLPQVVAVRVDGDDKEWRAFSLSVLEKVEAGK